MFPGLTSKLSESLVALATSFQPKSDVIHVTSTASTTVITTMIPSFGGFSGILVVVNRSGASITTVTTGNVQAAVTIPQNQTCLFVFSKITGKWYPGAIS